MIKRFTFWLLWWFAIGICLAPSYAFWQSRDSNYNQSIVSSGSGNVTPDVLGTQQFQASSNNFNVTPLTITAALTNPGLECSLIRADNINDVTSGVALTWNGTLMTLRVTQQGGVPQQAVFLFGLRNPVSGLKTLNLSATNIAADNFVNCVSFSNVNQTSDALAFPNPTGTTTTANIPITSSSGHIAVGVSFGNFATVMLGTTVINDASHGSVVNAFADYVLSTSGTTSVGATVIAQTAIAGMDISN